MLLITVKYLTQSTSIAVNFQKRVGTFDTTFMVENTKITFLQMIGVGASRKLASRIQENLTLSILSLQNNLYVLTNDSEPLT